MSKRNTLDPVIIDSISRNIFFVLPLLRKRLLPVDAIQNVHGIPFSHVQVLSILEEMGEMSVSEISVRLGMAKPNITPLVDRLIANEYVRRIKDIKDKRVVNIVILDRGKEKLQAIQQTTREQIMESAEEISASDFRELAVSLQNISRIFTQLL